MSEDDSDNDDEYVSNTKPEEECDFISTEDLMLEYLNYSWETNSTAGRALEEDYLWHFYSSDFDFDHLTACEEYERDLHIGWCIVRQTLSNTVIKYWNLTLVILIKSILMFNTTC